MRKDFRENAGNQGVKQSFNIKKNKSFKRIFLAVAES